LAAKWRRRSGRAPLPQNVEIKVRIADLAAAAAIVRGLGAHPHEIIEQVDRYYEVDARRRMKLRTVAGRPAEMITYTRPETSGVRVSDYEVSPVRDGICMVPKGRPKLLVRKRREVLLLDNVRVHLDQVDGLGTFLELEAVVDSTHDQAACRRQIDAIVAALGVADGDLLRASYADLLRDR
jgi:adenylate cyclase class IV